LFNPETRERYFMVQYRLEARNRRGVAAVELAVVLSLFFVLLVGIWEVARMVHVQEILSSAAREGGRQASTGIFTNVQVQKIVLHHINNQGVQVTDSSDNPFSGVAVTVTNNTSTGVDASLANKLDSFTIGVTLPFSLVRFSALNHFVNNTTTMGATVNWYSMKNNPFTVNQTMPTIPQ
jgi:Flp pilus assembly protein TadG